MRSRERAYPVQYLRILADSRQIIKAAEAARRAVVFGSPKATGDLLSIIAGGLMTVTSITISLLLLLALQQAAVSMTSEVVDQFLRRRINQVYFGVFVGVALYALVTLATVSDNFNPVHGATLAFVLTVSALYLLILLLYTTINQMRSIEIIEAIHDHILAAWERQRHFVHKMRRAPQYDGRVRARIGATRHGYVTRIDLEAIGAATRALRDEVEVVLLVSIGSFVAFEDAIGDQGAVTRRGDRGREDRARRRPSRAPAGHRARPRVWDRADRDDRLDVDLDLQIEPGAGTPGDSQSPRSAGPVVEPGQ